MAITLSENAAERVKNFIRSQPQALGLRLGVKETGCSGYEYIVDLTQHIGESDEVFQSNGVNIVVDTTSLAMLDGTHIEFGRQGLNEGFEYHNPNVKALCGCGESFSI